MDTSKIKNINIDEVKLYLNNESSYSIPRDPLNSSPRLFFYSEEDITPKYYNFTIDGLDFKECWIQPHSKVDGGLTKYCSGSYYVIQNLS